MSSRTNKSMILFTSEVIFKVLITVLGIVKTRMLIGYLGDSMNGLYQLIIQLLAFVTIADLGLDSIYRFAYYKPLAQQDYVKVNEIYNGSKVFFRYSALVMFVIACFISLLFPFLASQSSFSFWQLILIMFIFALPSVVEALFSADISLVSAQQRNFQVHFINNIKFIVRILFSFLTIMNRNFIVFILVDSFVAIGFTILRYLLLKNYNVVYKKHTKEKDYSPLTLTKYTLFTNINYIVYNNTDNIVISQFLTLTFVSVYSSFYFVVKALSDIITISIGSIVDIVGNLFAENKNTYQAFAQLEALLFFISIVLATPLFLGLDHFISLAISNTALYRIDFMSYSLFIILFIIIIVSSIWDVIVKANGLYQYYWKISLVESILNIVISVSLVSVYRFQGVLLGTILSRMIKYFYCKFIMGEKLQFPMQRQFYTLALNVAFMVGILYLVIMIKKFVIITSLLHWVFIMVASTIGAFVVCFVIYYALSADFKVLMHALVQVVKQKRIKKEIV